MTTKIADQYAAIAAGLAKLEAAKRPVTIESFKQVSVPSAVHFTILPSPPPGHVWVIYNDGKRRPALDVATDKCPHCRGDKLKPWDQCVPCMVINVPSHGVHISSDFQKNVNGGVIGY